MNLIGNDSHAMTDADVAHAAQLIKSPDAARGVMRVAEQENLSVWEGSFSLKVVPVNDIAVVSADELILNQMALAVIDAREETVVGRSLHQDAATILTLKALNDGGHGWNDTNGVDDPVGLDMPIIAAGVPIGYGVIETLWHTGVAVDVMIDASLYCLDNLRGYTEIHVGHPKRDYILLGGVDVPLVTVCSAAIGGRVEIVRHNFCQLSDCCASSQATQKFELRKERAVSGIVPYTRRAAGQVRGKVAHGLRRNTIELSARVSTRHAAGGL